MWRLGQAKSHEGFPSVTSFKYLGVMLSYGNFEKATLQHRLQEGNAKLQQVRKFVHNRRTAGPRSRLHIWHSTVWATVSSGLVDVGLTAETATLLRAWHAKKIRAVLNCPAHLTHKSTSDLYRAHDIVDPVLKLQKRHANRVKRLLKRHRLSQTGDVALASPALEQALFLRGQYQSVIAQLDAAATPAATRRAEGSGRSGSAYNCLYVISLRFASQTTAPSFHSTDPHSCRAGSRASLQGTSGVLSHMWFLDP